VVLPRNLAGHAESLVPPTGVFLDQVDERRHQPLGVEPAGSVQLVGAATLELATLERVTRRPTERCQSRSHFGLGNTVRDAQTAVVVFESHIEEG